MPQDAVLSPRGQTQMIYGTFLFLHTIIRWVALIAGLVVVARASLGIAQRGPYQPSHRTAGTVFVSALHLNVLIGIVLYVAFSPQTHAAFADIGAAMKSAGLRFFLVEHPFGMLLGTVLATVGAAKARRADDDHGKHMRTLAFMGGGLVAIIASIPWPFYAAGRPLLWFPHF